MRYIHSFLIIFTVVILLNSCGGGNTSKARKIETFVAAKEIVPGSWISTDRVNSNISVYNLLLFSKDGSLKFAQGTSPESALKLANESKAGKWSVDESSDLLPNLKNDQRFLIDFELEGFGSEILRVEIYPDKYLMGRIANNNDAIRESVGLFAIGAKYFINNKMENQYLIYENWRAEKKVVVHKATCGDAKEGHERIKDAWRILNHSPNDRWFGYFSSFNEAVAFASLFPNRQLKYCGHCLKTEKK